MNLWIGLIVYTIVFVIAVIAVYKRSNTSYPLWQFSLLYIIVIISGYSAALCGLFIFLA